MCEHITDFVVWAVAAGLGLHMNSIVPQVRAQGAALQSLQVPALWLRLSRGMLLHSWSLGMLCIKIVGTLCLVQNNAHGRPVPHTLHVARTFPVQAESQSKP